MANLEAIAEAVDKGDRETVVRLVQEALSEKVPAEQILKRGLVVGMDRIRHKFTTNEAFIPEVLIADRAMDAGWKILEPFIKGLKPVGTVAIGTVKQDLHDIGKNLVAKMLRGHGFQVIDVGVDCDVQKFVAAARQQGTQIVALSALLTTTMPNMKEVITALKAAGLRNVKVMIGGAPVTQAYADEIGADGYAADAGSAVDLAMSLLTAGEAVKAARPAKKPVAKKAPAKKKPAKKAAAKKKSARKKPAKKAAAKKKPAKKAAAKKKPARKAAAKKKPAKKRK
jgi:5-methyltetrahydrofolate--homocysteine methyltransferase